ncbi:MAG: DUF4835 family protein [Flavipsychrobacter sp.]|nr:DUF4835 family protein [Flavipsychrobacter sp.]
MLKKLFSALMILLAAAVPGMAQELNCKVTITRDKITGAGVDPQMFTNMQRAIADFMNSHRWTTEEYSASERIECSIFINLVSNNVGGDPYAFTGTFSIQAARPVYNTSYTTNLVNFIDKEFAFKFSPFNPLNFDDNRVNGTDALSSNLTAMLAYYAYIIVGLDNDSFSPNGGTAILKKAQSLVNNAPEGKGIGGWKAIENNRNRYWLIDQMLNQRFQDVRSFWYTMHREGLDSMSMKPTEARTRIMVNIKKLYQVNKENPSSIYMQFLFNAKSDEFIRLLELTPKQERQQYITLLSALDVANSAKYNALK